MLHLTRWHEFVRVLAEDASDQLAFVGFAGNDGEFARLGLLDGGIADIQTQSAFPSAVIRSVAFEAVRRKNGADLAKKVWGFDSGAATDQKQRSDDRQ